MQSLSDKMASIEIGRRERLTICWATLQSGQASEVRSAPRVDSSVSVYMLRVDERATWKQEDFSPLCPERWGQSFEFGPTGGHFQQELL